MSQIEFTEQSEGSPTGRVRSRVLHRPALSYIKLMYLVNLVFIAVWAVLTCLAVVEPEAEFVPLPQWLVGVLAVTGFLVAFAVIFSLKFGKLGLLLAARTYFRIKCASIAVLGVLGLHYINFRKDFLLIVFTYLYLYQEFLTSLKNRWPDIEQQRWTEYMDPISKFQNTRHEHEEEPLPSA